MKLVRIGLVRHLEVAMPMPSGWLCARDLTVWREKYDQADLLDSEPEASTIEWSRCIASDLPRAVRTAEKLFAGPIEQTPLLREPDVAEFRTGRLRLTSGGWKWVLRAAWMTGHSSQRAARDDFMSRLNAIAQQLISSEGDTLVVSHAGVMLFLQKKLRAAGFRGPQFRMAQHGKMYLFEK